MNVFSTAGVILEFASYLCNKDIRALMNTHSFTRRILINADVWKNNDNQYYTSTDYKGINIVATAVKKPIDTIFNNSSPSYKVMMIELYCAKIIRKIDYPNFIYAEILDFRIMYRIGMMFGYHAKHKYFTLYRKVAKYYTKMGYGDISANKFTNHIIIGSNYILVQFDKKYLLTICIKTHIDGNHSIHIDFSTIHKGKKIAYKYAQGGYAEYKKNIMDMANIIGCDSVDLNNIPLIFALYFTGSSVNKQKFESFLIKNIESITY